MVTTRMVQSKELTIRSKLLNELLMAFVTSLIGSTLSGIGEQPMPVFLSLFEKNKGHLSSLCYDLSA
jgi:hypothetical protein